MLQSVTLDQFIVGLLNYSKSNHRYKSLFLNGTDLREISTVIRQISLVTSEIQFIDGVKLFFSIEAPFLVDPTETKYWFQDKVVNAPLTCVNRFDGLTGRWSKQEMALWLDFIAKLETNNSVLFCSGMANLSDNWEQVANIAGTGLTICKPCSSRFTFDS